MIALFHGGSEYFPLPTPRQREFARFLVEAGAHAVVCHHSHVTGPLEWYHGCPIAYGLGNLLFPDKTAEHGPEWFKGYVLVLDADTSGITGARLVGTRFDPAISSLRLLDEGEYAESVARLSSLQDALGDADGSRRMWMDHVKKERPHYLSTVLGLSRVERALLRITAWSSWRMPRGRVPALLNVVRCESHHEAIVALLEEEL